MNEEIMIASYKDIRLACTQQQMEQLAGQGWKAINTMKIGGQRRYTMALPETRSNGHPVYELNPIERFRYYLLSAVGAWKKTA